MTLTLPQDQTSERLNEHRISLSKIFALKLKTFFEFFSSIRTTKNRIKTKLGPPEVDVGLGHAAAAAVLDLRPDVHLLARHVAAAVQGDVAWRYNVTIS